MNELLPSEIARLRQQITSESNRARLGIMPYWGHRWGPGQTRFLDVPPIGTWPRVRGMIRDEGYLPGQNHMPILASPLGIVAVRTGPLITVFDPDTGKINATVPISGNSCPPIAIVGEMLVMMGFQMFCAIELWNDQTVYRSPLQVANGTVSVWSLRSPRLRLKEPKLTVSVPKGFRTDFSGGYSIDHNTLVIYGPYPLASTGMAVGHSMSVLVGNNAIVLNSLTNNIHACCHSAIDPRTGRVLWTAPGIADCIDDEGVLSTHVNNELTLRSCEGKVLWTAKTEYQVALSPERVLGNLNGKLMIYHRRTGKLVQQIDEPSLSMIHGDQIVCAIGRRMYGYTLNGREIWRYENDENIHSFAPYPGRIYALTDRKTIVCLEDSAS